MEFEGIPQGIELTEDWQPVISSPVYRKRLAILTTAACLLACGFIAGTYCLWNHLLDCELGYWKAMRIWALGIVIFPMCFWPILRGIAYAYSYASPRGIYAILAAYLIAGSTYCLYTFILPFTDTMVWKVFIAIPGFILILLPIVDGVINVTEYFCVEWRNSVQKG